MKKVSGIYTAPRRHWVGDGFPVRTMFSYSSHGEHVSPFLMLDYAGNDALSSVYGNLRVSLLMERVLSGWNVEGLTDELCEQHIALYRAYEAGDLAAAQKVIRAHVELGRKTRPDLKLGICGEHGGDPASIHFFEKVGLDYVSASPYRVPVARLAAAQAALSVRVGD